MNPPVDQFSWLTMVQTFVLKAEGIGPITACLVLQKAMDLNVNCLRWEMLSGQASDFAMWAAGRAARPPWLPKDFEVVPI